MDAADILRRIDRGTSQDPEDLPDTPEGASELLIGHVNLFYEQLAAVTHGMKPGCQRLMLTMEIFWEGYFRRRALRAHCIPILRNHPLAAAVHERGESVRELIHVDLKAGGVEPIEEQTSELMRRIRDVAREELARDQRLPALRQIQYEWLERLCHNAKHRSLGKIDLR